ncbi:hypothetical protein PoB_003956000 [Plakobranchus ocellatus]|uniref:Uncharacterized protein n=1 Tax=Plakobranchus ocellatus TaxID=259542 RepID=A0AAV4B0H2_9GAST|nr:hypothetical protein PoB_003956000 [Plakobranchus ocellatus]
MDVRKYNDFQPGGGGDSEDRDVRSLLIAQVCVNSSSLETTEFILAAGNLHEDVKDEDDNNSSSSNSNILTTAAAKATTTTTRDEEQQQQRRRRQQQQ